MDGQTDVGHINLIGGLVTRNPPKKYYVTQAGHMPQSDHVLEKYVNVYMQQINDVTMCQ